MYMAHLHVSLNSSSIFLFHGVYFLESEDNRMLVTTGHRFTFVPMRKLKARKVKECAEGHSISLWPR